MTRDDLFWGRIAIARDEVQVLATKLDALIVLAPHSGNAQETRLRLIESSIVDCIEFTNRIAEFAGTGEKT